MWYSEPEDSDTDPKLFWKSLDPDPGVYIFKEEDAG
jgi:hypothetical protein